MRRLTLLVLSLLLCACNALTQENFAKVQIGLGREEVVGLIGKPSECSRNVIGEVCHWQDGQRQASVTFVADKVVLFASENL